MATISNASAQNTASNLPKEKQTTLGLYVTAAEAYEKWKASPDSVFILDVRTPDEYMDIGHAEMAWNIPAFLQSWQWNEQAKHFGIKPNPDFMISCQRGF